MMRNNKLSALPPLFPVPPSLLLTGRLSLSLLLLEAGWWFPASRLRPPQGPPEGLRGAGTCQNLPELAMSHTRQPWPLLTETLQPCCCPKSLLGPTELPLPSVALGAAPASSDMEDSATARGVTLNQREMAPVTTSALLLSTCRPES